MLFEADVTVANVRLTPSSVLLQCRGRNVRARYVHLWTSFAWHKVQPFKLSLGEVERTGSEHVRVNSLLAFIHSHERRIAGPE